MWVKVASSYRIMFILKLLPLLANRDGMTYIVIDTTDKQSEAFLKYVKTLPFAKIESGSNVATIKAMEQVKKGKTTKHKNAKDLVSFLNK